MSNYSVHLAGPAPWGFRLQGGKDFNMPLTISRLNDGGKAAKANIGIGDVVQSIDGVSTDGMTHLEAQNKIKASSGSLSLNLQKASAVQKTNPNPPQTESPREIVKPVPIASPTPAVPKVNTSLAYNKAPKPFGSSSSSKVAFIPSPSSAFTPATANLSNQAPSQPSALSLLAAVNPPQRPTSPGSHANYRVPTDGQPSASSAFTKTANVPRQSGSYSTNANLYAQEAGQDSLDSQRRGQTENHGDKQQNGKIPPKRPPRKHIVDSYPDIYHTSAFSDASKKRLIDNTEDWHPRTGTTQSRSFRILAQMTGTEHMNEPEPENVSKTKSEPPPLEKPEIEETCLASTLSSSPAKASMDPVPSTTAVGRKSLFNNPLDSLPKCAPCAPAIVQVLMLNSQVATISRTAFVHTSKLQLATINSAAHPQSTYSGPTVRNGTGLKILSESHTIGIQTGEPASSEKPPEDVATTSSSSPMLVRHEKTTISTENVSSLSSAAHISSVHSQASLAQTSDSLETTSGTTYNVAQTKSMPSSYKSPPFKPSGQTTNAKPASWQPAPSTGRISKYPHATKPGAGVKPVAPPPGADQDTLVQRAEHIPAGTRTPMCAICNLVIRGPFLLALGKSWHPEEFNCNHCQKNMAEMGFVLEKGSLYCEICYEKFLAPECARCQTKVLGEVINALKLSWHVSCFVCVACNTPIRNSVFHLEDGEPYCETDYYSMFGTICHGCEFPIEAGDKFLEALGHAWHNTCFVCAVCCESLEGQTFFSKKDKPLCKKHAHAVNI
uniref:PDZ and LIM domain 5 n=1 Tax=Leptobrachium leishanense TaxID=445787 RepID=A0A8C5MAP9_9ANUR